MRKPMYYISRIGRGSGGRAALAKDPIAERRQLEGRLLRLRDDSERAVAADAKEADRPRGVRLEEGIIKAVGKDGDALTKR